MARTITLAEIRTAVLSRGGWGVSTDLTPVVLNDYVNEAIAELWDLLIAADKNRYATSTTLSTAVGSDSVSLPPDFYELRKLELADGADWIWVRPHDLEAAHRFRASGARWYRYRLQGSNLRLVPTPQAIDTLRLWYIPWATRLVADADTFDGINGYEELVIQLTLLRCYRRQDMQTDETMAEVQRLTQRIRAAASDRDAAEPFYLDPYGPDESDVEEYWR